MADVMANKNDADPHGGLSHDHSHNHDHAPGHSHHHHAPKDFGFAFAIGTILNFLFVIVEAGAGVFANSTALLADAGHNLGDVLGLLLAWGASVLVRRRPTLNFTYGFGSTTILAALANAVLLLLAVGAITLEAVRSLFTPSPVGETTVIIVAAIGILINGCTAWLFASGREHDLNIRGAWLHLAGDAAISLGVVIAGIVMLFTGWTWLDPVMGLIIAAIIVAGTWGLLRDTIRLSLHGVPASIDAEAVQIRLQSLPEVANVHDLHIWPMSTTETALTCHLVVPKGHPGDAFIASATRMLHQDFGIRHATLQFELSGDAPCGMGEGCTGAATPG